MMTFTFDQFLNTFNYTNGCNKSALVAFICIVTANEDGSETTININGGFGTMLQSNPSETLYKIDPSLEEYKDYVVVSVSIELRSDDRLPMPIMALILTISKDVETACVWAAKKKSAEGE